MSKLSKRGYTEPRVDVVNFETLDVITTSDVESELGGGFGMWGGSSHSDD